MRWRGLPGSTNVEDRRGMGVGRGGMAIGGTGVLLILAVALLTGENPLVLLDAISGPSATVDEQEPGRMGPPSDELGQFASVVLKTTETVWGRAFAEAGRQYRPPTLVLFSEAVRSACGLNSAAVGPFYCPPDQKVYIDLSFFADLERLFGAPGDFAQAYVIAHEVGHHVQNLLGLSSRVQAERERSSPEEANAMSVRVELQADCLAGVWAYHADRDQDLLEAGDLEEGLGAAAAIGDDRLQRRSQGYTVPESWTHGSSAMRVHWLRRGAERGDIAACDTFQGDLQ